MVSEYVKQALRRSRYEKLEDGTYCATVPGLRGVVATSRTLEGCRDQLTEVIEEWILVRIAKGLVIPRLGGRTITVRKAS
jgi:predicted RNase H-like HicB family nuclease